MEADLVQLALRVPVALKKKAMAIAKKRGVTLSMIVRQYLMEVVKDGLNQ